MSKPGSTEHKSGYPDLARRSTTSSAAAPWEIGKNDLNSVPAPGGAGKGPTLRRMSHMRSVGSRFFSDASVSIHLCPQAPTASMTGLNSHSRFRQSIFKQVRIASLPGAAITNPQPPDLSISSREGRGTFSERLASTR